jgi:hypothetical protein
MTFRLSVPPRLVSNLSFSAMPRYKCRGLTPRLPTAKREAEQEWAGKETAGAPEAIQGGSTRSPRSVALR